LIKIFDANQKKVKSIEELNFAQTHQ